MSGKFGSPTLSLHRKIVKAGVSRLTLSVALLLQGMPAFAGELPTGGSVVAGQVSISAAGQGMTVSQGSDRAIVDWQGFSIGKDNSVNFVQPSSSSAILNRVTGSVPSTIAGSLTANGQVFIVNQNGIAITSTGTVKVGGGFVASTLDIDNKDFLSGNLTFKGNGASARLSNEGVISVGRGGYAALIGGTVKNSGLIAVPLGKVGLGSGEQATLDLSGDGFLQVAIPTKDGAEGDGALVENSGTIRAKGGTVVMKAATAREAARHAVNMSGTIEAKSIGGRNGAIVIGGGAGGKVTVSGKIRATSRHGNGGKVTITGRDIALKGAKIDVSGKTGGGTVKIGGDRQGLGTLPHAATLSMDAATTITANSTGEGDGGSIVLWSDGLTVAKGTLSAEGGTEGGNGGSIETSGHTVDFTGISVTTAAAKGIAGNWLLDPTDLIIDQALATTIGASLSGGTNVTLQTSASGAPTGAGTLTASEQNTAGNGDIIVNAGLSWSSGATLTLDSYHSILINATITAAGSANVALTTNEGGSGGDLSFGLRGSGFTGRLDFTGTQGQQALTINGTAYTLIYSMAQLAGIDGTGNYALATTQDAASTTYSGAVVGSNLAFGNTFEGLGHTVSNLKISSNQNNVGLFSRSDGIIRDIGVDKGSVQGGGYVGGLLGDQTGGAILNAYSTAAVSGQAFVGGLVGNQGSGAITNAYATGAVNGSGSNVGGLVGWSSGTITNSFATGAVTGAPSQGFDSVGGLVGWSTGDITNAYATGAVSGDSDVGGLVGQISGGTITNAYATGLVRGNTKVGGLVGYTRGVTVTNAYWDTGTTGQSTDAGGATGVTTAQLADATRLAALNTGSVAFGNAGNKTTPYLLNNPGAVILATDSSATPTYYTPILTQAGLEAANNNLSSNYVLANNLDLSGTTYTDALIGKDTSNPFTGIFDGLGNTISGLTINKSGDYAGLFGYSTGTLRNLGLIGGRVSGSYYVGSLVGYEDSGTISNVFATTSVSGYSRLGGLVGFQYGGAITNAYATGAVIGSQNSSSAYIGGLVGYLQGGTVSNAYATGVVIGSVDFGGLIGSQAGGSVTNGYWDPQTSGMPSSNGGSAKITAQFQGGAFPAGFDANVWGTGAGLYPYLKAFYPNGVQAVSGFAYKDAGATIAASGASGAVTVSLDGNGKLLGQVATGANGYYYIPVAAGTIASGTNFLVSTPANNATGVAAAATIATSTYTSGTPRQSGINLYGTYTSYLTPNLTYSQGLGYGSVVSTANSLAGSDAAASAVIAATTGVGYLATGASFTVDQAINDTGGLLIATSASGAGITVSNPINVGNGASLGLLAAGALTINSTITVTGAGSVALGYDRNTTSASATDLSFGLTGAGFTGSLNYGTTDAGGTLTINGNAYTLVYSMAQLDAIDARNSTNDVPIIGYGPGASGKYALANNLDASGTSYIEALVGSNSSPVFSGVFEGLGHTVTNLTITSSENNVGLFGSLSGTISDIGMAGGAVSSSGNVVGGLAGISYGSIANAYVTGAVSGGDNAGGLAGSSNGSIANAYATGAVSGGDNVGGLAGSNNGSITNAYATGAARGGNNVGGLVGFSNASIINSYATGAVNGYTEVGGLVGLIASGNVILNAYATGVVSGSIDVGGLIGLNSSSISNAYWDRSTSGLSTGIGAGTTSGATGLTTAQMQDGSSAGLGSAFRLTSGLYPYLTSVFPNGVQAVSGTVYSDAGSTTKSGVTVNVTANGNAFASASSGANGYYYAFAPTGSFSSGNSILSYTAANATTGATNAATLAVASGASPQTGVNIYANTLSETAANSVTSLSALNSLYTAAWGSGGALAGFDPTVGGYLLASRNLNASATTFTIDAGLTQSGTLTVTGSVGTTFAASGSAATVSAGTFMLTNGSWSQIASALPGFTATDFRITGGTFLRAKSGDGSSATPYLLTDIYGLQGIGSAGMLGLTYALANDVDASGTSNWWAGAGWNPVGTAVNKFAGTLDGTGHKISNLTINRPTQDAVALIGPFYGTLSNLGLVGGSIAGQNEVGSLVAVSTGTVSNVYATTSVSGQNGVGGLIGVTDGNVLNSYATGSVTSTTGNMVGGLVGHLIGSVTSSYAIGSVNGVSSGVNGGLVGFNEGLITSSFYDAQTTGQSDTGKGTGLTTAQLQDPFTFINAGWDFASVWGKSTSGANGGYMMLRPLSSGLYDDYVTVADASRVYGNANSTIAGGTVSGLGASNVLLNWGSAVATSSNVGDYAYSSSNVLSLSDSRGGKTVYADLSTGKLTISKATLTVTANAGSSTYGDTPSGLGYTATGWQNGQSNSLLSGVNVTTNATATSNAGGSYYTRASGGTLAGAASGNYAFAYLDGVFTVNQATLTVAANDVLKAFGTDAALTYTALGLKNQDRIGSVSLSSAGAAASAAFGTYPIVVGNALGLGLSNYRIIYMNGRLDVGFGAGVQLGSTLGLSGGTNTSGSTTPPWSIQVVRSPEPGDVTGSLPGAGGSTGGSGSQSQSAVIVTVANAQVSDVACVVSVNTALACAAGASSGR